MPAKGRLLDAFIKQMYPKPRIAKFCLFRISNLQAMLAKRFFERAQLSLQLPGPFPATNGRASRHHSVLFFPSNHFRRSATPMLYAFPSLAAGSSLACKAFRICLSFVPDENGRLFDGYRDAVEQWRLIRHNVAWMAG